jgi:hypothetical protein
MRHSEKFAVLFIPISFIIYILVRLPMKPEAWNTLEGLFGKQDEMRGHMLEVELLTLDLKIFENIQDLFKKFNNLLSQLKACGVDKSKEEK